MTPPASLSRRAESLLERLGLGYEHLLGFRFAVNVFVASAIVWFTLRWIRDSNPIWAIAAMLAATDPQPGEARRMFKSRLSNVLVGCAVGFGLLVVGARSDWMVPIALAATVLVSTYLVRIKTMWRQAPLTTVIIIAAGLSKGSTLAGIEQGLHKVAEVIFGCVMGVLVSLLMSRVWLVRPPGERADPPQGQSPGPLVFALVAIAFGAAPLHAQELSPRAYVITPLGSNAITLGNTYNTGDLLLEGAAPIKDATASLNAPSLTYYHAFSLFGRSANVVAGLAYGVGTFEGNVLGEQKSIRRSGLFDLVGRLSVNLVGGPAMSLKEMRTWQQKTLLGFSLKVVAPTGQYDPTKLINLGANRWAFKPELGLSRRWGHWLLDAYGAVWLFTENPEFFSKNQYFPGVQAQTQDPVAVLETHLSYDVRPRFWMSLDANFWRGGTTSANGVENPATFQQNSRVGITGAFPVTRHQSVKLSYSRGAYIRFGGDYQILSAAWQYSWISGSKPGPATR